MSTKYDVLPGMQVESTKVSQVALREQPSVAVTSNSGLAIPTTRGKGERLV